MAGFKISRSTSNELPFEVAVRLAGAPSASANRISVTLWV